MALDRIGTGCLDKRPLIAIVDDDASVRGSMKRLMISFGYNAESFPSVDEVLSCGELEEIACIIADIQMPEATGFDMQRALKSAGYGIPIIFITAFPNERGRDEAMKAGAQAYLRKPVNINELLQRIRSALSQE